VVKLAKDVIDFGLYTNHAEPMLEFWQKEVGLPYEEMLPAGAGVRQHRHGLSGSVFKLNDSRDPLPEQGPSGYAELLIARSLQGGLETLTDPDGNRIRFVEPGCDGIEGIGVRLRVRDESAFHGFYGEVIGLEACGERAYRFGRSVLMFDADPSLPENMVDTNNRKMRAPGYRYITAQVWNVDEVHEQLVARGAMEGFAPMTLGKVARISFIRDPDGNWIELSQRASLTGDLR
jgi:predicted enzyme related to lactoylglutathione lyase